MCGRVMEGGGGGEGNIEYFGLHLIYSLFLMYSNMSMLLLLLLACYKPLEFHVSFSHMS